MNEKIQIIDEIIKLSLEREIENKEDFHKTQNEVYKRYKLPEAIQSVEILERYNELVKEGIVEDVNNFRKVLRKRGVRSLSGVTVISLLTEFFGCPGKCIYCPTFEGLPKSYIPNEPAVQRAKLNLFDPIKQIHNRLRALEITGHKIEKNDVRIIGGTWSFYPKTYQENFIKGIYDAFNTYDEMKEHIEETNTSNDKFASFKMKMGYKLKLSENLEEAKKINETARCRVIGIAIETRPDWINPEEIARLRKYGITRVEIGYQTTIDEINILNKRGHTNKESIEATRLLKDAGFKVVAHMMPNLLGSTPDLDRKAMKEVFDNSDFRPDELKIYPMVVTDKAELTEIWKKGGFKAYDDETLIDLMSDLEAMIPEYVRINRTYRDIPASEILHGSTLSNLRQIVEEKLEKKGIKLLDIRHREIKAKLNNPENAVLHTIKYEASSGTEYFLTFEDKEDRTIFSLLRLRLPGENNEIIKVLPELKGCALIREIHTFGDQLSIGETGSTFGQHIGFGKKLIAEAENIAKKNGYNKMAVIAGVGVREYYKKRGYELEGEYMIKKVK
nr:tRNA uridine(34) 5-carboxymethylaminomethyl modification radical SAM/GNAT enzyme Elp3 [Candidatus Gracilibacteria bacterium]